MTPTENDLAVRAPSLRDKLSRCQRCGDRIDTSTRPVEKQDANRQILELALEALEWEWGGEPQSSLTWKAILWLRERLSKFEKTENVETATSTSGGVERPGLLAENGGKTGYPPGLLQDDDRKLSRWLASRPDAREQSRQAAAEIASAHIAARNDENGEKYVNSRTLTQPARPEQEPVAWMYDFPSPDNPREDMVRDWVTQSLEEVQRSHGFNVRPLFAAPQPAVPKGYALIGIEALKAWGKYDQLAAACAHPADATQPAAREWQGLTDEDFRAMGLSARPGAYAAIEARLREKNRGERR